MHVTELQFLALFRAWGRLPLPPRPPHAFLGRKYGQRRGRFSERQPFKQVMPVRLFPRPARRALAVSAAIGRFDRNPHRTGAAEPATAAAADALDGAAPAEPRTGQKRKASRSPEVRPKLLARARYCAPHACADAQGCDSGSDCTALHCAALRCSVLEGTALHCTASALHLHSTVQRTGSCRRCLRPLPRVRTAHAALWGRLVMRTRW